MPISGMLWARQWTFLRRISWVAERPLLASKEGLCCLQLIAYWKNQLLTPSGNRYEVQLFCSLYAAVLSVFRRLLLRVLNSNQTIEFRVVIGYVQFILRPPDVLEDETGMWSDFFCTPPFSFALSAIINEQIKGVAKKLIRLLAKSSGKRLWHASLYSECTGNYTLLQMGRI
jgi:hypothetical protein